MASGRKREWVRKKMAAAVAGGSPRWALRTHRPRRRVGVHLVRLLYESVVFRLLWVLESMVVLASLCFFFLRFGFRL